MRKSTVYDFLFDTNNSSTLCSRLTSIAKSMFFTTSSSDDLFAAMSTRTFGTAKLSCKKFTMPFSQRRVGVNIRCVKPEKRFPRPDVVEPCLNSVERDKRQYTKFRKRSESSNEFKNRHRFEHEPHCPLFKIKLNSTIDDRIAERERKSFNVQANRNETNFQKFLRLAGPFNAKYLVDKYFDGYAHEM